MQHDTRRTSQLLPTPGSLLSRAWEADARVGTWGPEGGAERLVRMNAVARQVIAVGRSGERPGLGPALPEDAPGLAQSCSVRPLPSGCRRKELPTAGSSLTQADRFLLVFRVCFCLAPFEIGYDVGGKAAAAGSLVASVVSTACGLPEDGWAETSVTVLRLL